ncbi:MAG: ABC transporter permease [Lachnospiraceae bacterium]|nr:ABC transporter permease [Lachnospiraceae bacterium]
MNKGMFSGWRDVFSFTLKQATGKKFRNVTVGLALIMLVAGLAISTIMAFIQKREDGKRSPIGQVQVVDNSGLEVLYLEGFAARYGETFPDVSFVEAQQSVEELAVTLGEQEPESVILEINRTSEGYLLTVVLPYGSEIGKGDAEDLCEAFASVMEQSKLLSSGIPMEKLVLAMSGVQTNQLDAGEEERSIGEQLVAMLAPMLIIFFMYFMTLMYGMSVGNTVSVEKCSKLMEMMLTLTRPYGLIFGKVLAITVTAIGQILLWFVCLVGGFFLGHEIAGAVIYPDYHNVLLEIFVLIRGQVGSTAFTPGAMVLAVFTICLSFLFYCMLAGLIASFAGKAEELGQVMSFYQLAMIAGFLGSYMLPLQEKDWLNTILRIVPLTSAYMLPGDILVGNVTVPQGLLFVAILVIFTAVLVVCTGRIYRNQMFNRGRSLKERLRRKKSA